MIRKQSPATVSTICFRIIMAVLFASYFYNTVSCTLPKAPGLPGVAEAEGNNTKRQKYSDGNLLPSLCLCFFVLDFVGKCIKIEITIRQLYSCDKV